MLTVALLYVYSAFLQRVSCWGSVVCTTQCFIATYSQHPTVLTEYENTHSNGVTATSGSVSGFDLSVTTHNFSHTFASGLPIQPG